MYSSKKRVLVKEEPQKKDVLSKRAKKTNGKPAVASNLKRTVSVSIVKSEKATKSAPAGTVFKASSGTSVSLKDIPPECLRGFRVAFRPAIRDLVGTLDPWEFPSDTDVVRIWNDCFPKHRLRVSSGLFSIVSKLVKETVKQWRWEFADAAVKCVNKTLKTSFNNQSARVSHAAWLLGNDDKDRKRPFYYKRYENGIQPCGIFQSPIVATTLATHFTSISCLPEEARLQDYPTGALALSILAVKRALTWAKTGVDSIPNTCEGHFSRANWGDHYKLEGNRYVVVKGASNIVAVINKLRDIHWERILAEAERYANEKKATVSKTLKKAEESDFEVEDWDDDFE